LLQYKPDFDPFDVFARRFGIYFHKPTYPINKELNLPANSLMLSETSPDVLRGRRVLEGQKMTPNSDLDDAAWFAWKKVQCCLINL